MWPLHQLQRSHECKENQKRIRMRQLSGITRQWKPHKSHTEDLDKGCDALTRHSGEALIGPATFI